MTWQSYVDDQLVGSGYVSQAAMCGLDGSIWAKSVGLTEVSPEEVKSIVSGFNDSTIFYSSGLRFNGIKFVYLSGADNVIRAKSVDRKFGLHCVKTQQAVAIAIYSEPIQPQQAATVVENLGDYLVKCGY